MKRLIELFDLPQGVYPVFGMVMGYPEENTDEMAKPRLPIEVVYKEDRYRTEDDENGLVSMTRIRKYYIDRTKESEMNLDRTNV